MASLPRDENRIPVIGGLNSLDSATPISIYADATTHRLYVEVQGEVATDAKLDDIITELEQKTEPADVQNVDVNALAAVYTGTKTVPTGTAEVIASTQTIHSVTIKALSTNTVAVYIGGSGVTVSGFELLAGESVTLDINDLVKVYCISGSADQVVRYMAV